MEETLTFYSAVLPRENIFFEFTCLNFPASLKNKVITSALCGANGKRIRGKALEGVCKVRLCRFSGSFEPIFDFLGGVDIDQSILILPRKSKIGSKGPEKSTNPRFADTLLARANNILPKWRQQ